MTAADCRPQRDRLVPPGGIDVFDRDMTVTVAGDVPLIELQSRLAMAGQWLPIDGDPATPLCHLVESNSTGPLRLGYGGWRDLLLGCQFTNGRGELITAGGRAMKNVAGYDLTKFMVGQQGVFGKIVTITTRTYRRPAAALLARFPSDIRLVHRLLPTAQKPQWMLLTPTELLYGYMGDQRTVAYYAATVGEHHPTELIERSIDADIEHRARLWSTVQKGTIRASVPPARLAEFTKLLGDEWVADAAFGMVQILWSSDASLIFTAAKAVGGSCLQYASDGEPPVYAGPVQMEQRQLLNRMKQAFDPDGRLAPLPAELGLT